ncbi:MAG: hypothetical protein K2Q06_11405, partial [Parvularculaceae bacterium]|nr:hypothetical protein [Parvularculaceae bacterium]
VMNAFARLAAAVALGLFGSMSAGPAAAQAPVERVVVLGQDGDLLKQLIELDAAGIEDLRRDFEDARSQIEQSIGEVERARAEARNLPFGRFAVRLAFASAATATTESAQQGFRDARASLQKAEIDLRSADVSAAERAETQGAIDMIRGQFVGLEDALQRLAIALKG